MPADAAVLRRLYVTMLRIRLFEERVAQLVAAGEIQCPCHLCIGQEAIAAGVCAALATTDYVWGGHRSHGHYIAKGGELPALMAELYGRETGCAGGRGGSMHLIAPEVGILGTVPLVAATIPLAVGTALASKLRRDQRISVSFFGDGAMEEGHFHESLNLAALYCLPVIFVCENNFYASHMGLLERRAIDRLEQAGHAQGVSSWRVDGNAADLVYDGAVAAVARARAGQGPTLLVCDTYRWRGHVGPSWDEDVGVKRKDELHAWIDKDPIGSLGRRLAALGIPDEELAREKTLVTTEIESSVQFARESPRPDPKGVASYVFGLAKHGP
jgi:TPP-dependent pyruvate/acetoin dehydrogenase alpha subunit